LICKQFISFPLIHSSPPCLVFSVIDHHIFRVCFMSSKINYYYNYILFLVTWGGVRLNPPGTSPLIGLLYQSRLIDEYRTFGGMKIGRRNWRSRRKLAPKLLCPP
jgi:hypothetical protein